MNYGTVPVFYLTTHTPDMTHTYKQLKRILTGTVILLIMCLSTSAQTVAEVISDSENSVVFRIENIDANQSPTRIVLVYDSNLITLESESSNSSRLFNQKTTYSSSTQQYNAASVLASALAVEIEREVEIEDWMMKPFDIKGTTAFYAKADKEPELSVEEWMYDLSTW